MLHVQIQRTALVNALSRAVPIVKTNTSLIVLSYFKLTARRTPDAPNPSDGELVIEATNLDTTFQTVTPCTIVGSGEGVALAPGARLYDVVRALSAQDVSLRAEENGYMNLKAGKASSRLPSMPAAAFAEMPSVPSAGEMVGLPTAQVLALIEATSYAVSTDEGRPSLNGVFIQANASHLRAAATDGHRLSLWAQPLGAEVKTPPALSKGIIAPRHGLAVLRGMLDVQRDTTHLHVQDNRLHVRHGHSALSLRLVEGAFPDVASVLPGESAESDLPRVNKAALLSALKLVSLCAPPRTGNVRLTLLGQGEGSVLEIYTHDSEQGEAREEVPCDLPPSWGDKRPQAGFNFRYLQDALHTLHGDEVTLAILDTLAPALLRACGEQRDTVLSVVMPMRI